MNGNKKKSNNNNNNLSKKLNDIDENDIYDMYGDDDDEADLQNECEYDDDLEDQKRHVALGIKQNDDVYNAGGKDLNIVPGGVVEAMEITSIAVNSVNQFIEIVQKL